MALLPFLTVLEGQVDRHREMKKRHLNLLPLSKVDPAIEGNKKLLQFFTFMSKQVRYVRLQDARSGRLPQRHLASRCILHTTYLFTRRSRRSVLITRL